MNSAEVFSKIKMKILLLTLLSIFISLFSVHQAFNEDSLQFNWALLKKMSNGLAVSVDFDQNPTVTNGDQLQFYFAMPAPILIYLYLFSSEKELDILFPINTEVYEQGPLKPGESSHPVRKVA